MENKSILSKVEEAIKAVINGAATQYVYTNGKTIRVSNHGANHERTDSDTYSLVINNDGQSYRSDRGRVISNWERSNQFYLDNSGEFTEQFESIESFLEYQELI